MSRQEKFDTIQSAISKLNAVHTEMMKLMMAGELEREEFDQIYSLYDQLGYDRARNGDLEKTVTAVYESAPAADVVEVRHGRWIVKGDAQPMSNDKVYGCSLCDDKDRRYYEWQLSNYCPNCGAKMDGGRDDA